MDQTRRTRWLLAALMVLVLASSLSGIVNGFVFDDQIAVVGNDLAHSPWPPWVPFQHSYWPPRLGGGLYRPLTVLLFAVQWAVSGGTPLLFHVVNLLVLVAVTVLVFLVARRCAGEWPAWIGAAAFAVHPVHVEAVANVVGQAELTAALCCLAATLIYLRCRQGESGLPSASQSLGICALYLAGMLCKEHAIVLPGLFLLFEWTVLRRTTKGALRVSRALPLYLGLLVTAAIYLSAREAVLGSLTHDIAARGLGSLTAGQRLLTFFATVPQWLRLLFWPARLRADYGFPEIQPTLELDPMVVAGAAILVAILGLAVMLRSRLPLFALAVGWIAVTVLPSSNLLFPTGILLAERTLFLPSVGAALVLTTLTEFYGSWLTGTLVRRRLAIACLALLLATGAWRSLRRQRIWHDEETLRLNMVLDAPNSAWAHWLYGSYLFEQGWHDVGERQIMASIHLDPGNYYTRARLGEIYVQFGFCPAAIPQLRTALVLSPVHAEVRARLIACLLQGGQYEPARREARLGLATGELPVVYQRALVSIDSAEAARAR